jgi:hypothetical protein
MKAYSAVMRVLLAAAVCAVYPSTGESQAAKGEPQGAKGDVWFSLSTRTREFEEIKDVSGKFTIQLPRDWQFLPGYSGVLFTAFERPKGDRSFAAIVLEQMPLNAAVTPKDITAGFAKVEADATRDRQIGAEGFEHELKGTPDRRHIFIQYSKPGWKGADRIVQYSIPVGAVMYRLICVAPAAQLDRYQPIFAHAAASFNPS